MMMSEIHRRCVAVVAVVAVAAFGLSLHAEPGDPVELECFFEDDFGDLSNWDVPAENAGLDAANCGLENGLDVGSVELGDGSMLLHPAKVPLPVIEAPLGMVTMSNAAASSFSGQESYRTKFTMLAHPGVIGAAIFVEQHHFFDEEAGTIDIGPETMAGGMGFTISFDCPHNLDRDCDHVHPDTRSFCLQENDPLGPSDPRLPGGLLTESGVPYTVILDLDGDPDSGPLTLQMKIYPADDDEPEDYLATWKHETGLGVNVDEEFDHGLFLVAIGLSESALEISDLSVCEIPTKDKHVRCVTCTRDFDGNVLVTWENPFDAEDEPLSIVVNGEEVDVVDGDETEYLVDSPPEEDLVIEVINYSCVAASCEICFNREPEVVIDGPANTTLEGDTVTVTVDSSQSTDGNGGTQELTRFWTIIDQPEGSDATIDDQTAEIIQLTVDSNGEYTLNLSLSDGGCTGDFIDSLESNATYTLEVGQVKTGGFNRGDPNDSGVLDIADGIFILNFLFTGGPAPTCMESANSNDDGNVDLSDGVYLLAHLFTGGPEPAAPGRPSLPCGPDPVDSVNDLGCESYTSCGED